ncbi:MAG: hypothetical protein EBT30_09290 [Verrucomicrobia bacterium]|nr:hypothetical protein [Verrucomicrobiota bacterium]
MGCWIWMASGCGLDPRARFEGEVRGMIAEAQRGKYLELEGAMSAGLKGRIQSEGWEPKAALAVVARRDREEGAMYQLRDVPKLEGSYAEAEIGRVAGGREKRMVVPFVREDGKWRVAAAYRDGRSWEGEDF